MSKNLRPTHEELLSTPFPWAAREDRVIIYPDEMPKVTEGGLHIPEAAVGKPSTGIVVEVGPGTKDKDGYLKLILQFLVWMWKQWTEIQLSKLFHHADSYHAVKNTIDRVPSEFEQQSSTADIQRGDRVMYGRYAGTEVEVNDTLFIIVRQSDIMLRDRKQILSPSELPASDAPASPQS